MHSENQRPRSPCVRGTAKYFFFGPVTPCLLMHSENQRYIWVEHEVPDLYDLYLSGTEAQPGEFIDAVITDAMEYDLVGKGRE
jgi:hypothetical protein